jgi:parallel beta-helix repeat protein
MNLQHPTTRTTHDHRRPARAVARRLLIAVVALAALALPLPADAAIQAPPPAAGDAPAPALGAVPSGYVRYVSTTGRDTWSGSSLRPWRTIQHAVDAIRTGGTVVVRGGTYRGFVLRRSNITVQGATGASVVVAGGTNVIAVRGVTSATIRRLTVRSASVQYGAGIRVDGSRNVLLERNLVRNNHSFGIKVRAATQVMIRSNEIRDNDTGIELSGAVGGTQVLSNRIHHNDHMVTASRGGNAIVFASTTGAVRVSGNRIWGNRALHLDGGGYDGGAFEVYRSSDLTISSNLLWDNNNAMETGTDGTAPCSRILFARNIVMGKGTVAGETTGLILRCADRSTIAHNVFDGVDDYAFYLSTSGGYAGSVDGLRILDNIVIRGRAYSIGSALPASLVLDRNLAWPGGSTATYADRVAYVSGFGNTSRLDEFRSWTGYEANGLQADPRFVDPGATDYHLRAGSPAIDAGIVAYGELFGGKAPDLGVYEVMP